MKYNPDIHHRRSIRLKGYDYAQPGAYFVTIVTKDRVCLFGDVVDGVMQLNETGEIIRQCWLDIPAHFPNVALDECVAMPNHMHGIIVVGAGSPRPYVESVTETASGANAAVNGVMRSDECVAMPNHMHGIIAVGAGSPRPYVESPANTASGAETVPLRRATLGQIVAYFKYQSAKRINERRGMPGVPVWQRNYYEHILRDERAFARIREYIVNNPMQWALDRENPAHQNGQGGI